MLENEVSQYLFIRLSNNASLLGQPLPLVVISSDDGGRVRWERRDEDRWDYGRSAPRVAPQADKKRFTSYGESVQTDAIVS